MRFCNHASSTLLPRVRVPFRRSRFKPTLRPETQDSPRAVSTGESLQKKRGAEIFSSRRGSALLGVPLLGSSSCEAFQSASLVTHFPAFIKTFVYSETRRDPLRSHRSGSAMGRLNRLQNRPDILSLQHTRHRRNIKGQSGNLGQCTNRGLNVPSDTRPRTDRTNAELGNQNNSSFCLRLHRQPISRGRAESLVFTD